MLNQIAFAVLTAWLGKEGPISENYCDEPPPAKAHVCKAAEAVASAAAERPMWNSDGGKIATALMLAAIARHESHLNHRVYTCERRGDEGRSITIFQLIRGRSWGGRYEELPDGKKKWIPNTVAMLCGDAGINLAARQSLTVLSYMKKEGGFWSPQTLFNSYAGNHGQPSKAGRELGRQWKSYMSAAGFRFNLWSNQEPMRPETPKIVVSAAGSSGS